jgi:4-deoxy-L-threo-5-hexosulose-uronate ketol-isomerase
MEIRQPISKDDVQTLTSTELRDRLVVENLFQEGKITLVMTHHDRLIVGGVICTSKKIPLNAPKEMSAKTFCEWREIGVTCLKPGKIEVDGRTYTMQTEDILYIGVGSKKIEFSGNGATFYFTSSPAQLPKPTTLVKKSDAHTVTIGKEENASLRTLRKYIHDLGVTANTMAMGVTTLHDGQVWNTMPCHVHERRTEAYLYFDIASDEKVMHFFGEPDSTRSFVLSNLQVVISPAWSIHTGCGTKNYKFIWSTSGENTTYTDFVGIPTKSLK